MTTRHFEVVRALPMAGNPNDGALLLNQPRHYYGWRTVLLMTTANLDAEAASNVLSHFQSRILVGTHAEMDIIARYAEMREGAAVNYVLKPVVLPLLKLIIDNTYSGQELSEFMSFVGMELKVPLTSIRGFSQVLEQKPR
ncbi:MAG: hypothetical protein U0694_14275 [Anaerolineae bacterium]